LLNFLPNKNPHIKLFGDCTNILDNAYWAKVELEGNWRELEMGESEVRLVVRRVLGKMEGKGDLEEIVGQGESIREVVEKLEKLIQM
jgi:hypothetical protein